MYVCAILHLSKLEVIVMFLDPVKISRHRLVLVNSRRCFIIGEEKEVFLSYRFIFLMHELNRT